MPVSSNTHQLVPPDNATRVKILGTSTSNLVVYVGDNLATWLPGTYIEVANECDAINFTLAAGPGSTVNFLSNGISTVKVGEYARVSYLGGNAWDAYIYPSGFAAVDGRVAYGGPGDIITNSGSFLYDQASGQFAVDSVAQTSAAGAAGGGALGVFAANAFPTQLTGGGISLFGGYGVIFPGGNEAVMSQIYIQAAIVQNAANGTSGITKAGDVFIGAGYADDGDTFKAGDIVIRTNNVERIRIEGTGTLQLAGDAGTLNQVLTSAGPSAPPTWQTPARTLLTIACSDESTPLTVGTNKVKFINPYSTVFNVTGVVASLSTAQSSGAIFTVDINTANVSILSTKITIDNTETNSGTAVTPPVISNSTIAAYAEIEVDIDQVGSGTATGLKIYLLGYPS